MMCLPSARVYTPAVRLSVISGTLNRRDGLERMLSSVQRGTAAPHRMIVGDAGSTDGTLEFLRNQSYADPVEQGRKMGFPRAYNDLIRRVDTEFTAFMADDTELVPGALDLAIQILDARTDMGAVALKMKDTQGHGEQRPYMGAVSKIGVLTANHIFIRTHLLHAIGGFDEGYGWYYADTDMSAAVLAAGWSMALTRPVCVRHHRDYIADGMDRNLERAAAGQRDYDHYQKRWSWVPEPTPDEHRRLLQARGAASLLWAGSESHEETRLGWNLLDFTNWAYMRWIDHRAELRGSPHPYYLEQRFPQAVLDHPLNPFRAQALAKREGLSETSGSAAISSSIPSETEMAVR